jgi:putative ABC transport system permease protein
LLSGAVIVSEPFADRMNLPMKGGMITLITRDGPRQFPVIGIYYDYASVAGTVIMALPVYQEFWDDQEITAVQLRLNSGSQVDEVVKDLQEAFAPVQSMRVQANQILKQEVLKVFDRTFLITGALQVIATVVAFIGILSALLSLELERQHELGILRSIGMTVGQVRALILSETGLMGAIAGILAMPAGYVLALILVYIINKRSFGWTLQMHIDPITFLEALGIALMAAVLAGIYPAFRIGKTNPSEALRSE